MELDGQAWDEVDEAVARLEKSWHASRGAELSQLVLGLAHPVRRLVLVTLIKVDQEYRWEAGHRKTLEEYLAEWPELRDTPDAIGELLTAECVTRAAREGLPTAKELQTRFPDVFSQIDLAIIEAEVESGSALVQNMNRAPSRPNTLQQTLDSTPSQKSDPPAMIARECFGRYEIRGLLGRGGMGTVYRAYDTHLEREVALKIPHFDPSLEPVVIERLIREAKAAASIEHPNICTIFDAGQVGETPFIAMRLIEGRSLAARMQDSPMDPHEAVQIVRKLAVALETAHSHGIVHRDIKPSNVMIDQTGEPQLTDFGLARRTRGEGKLAEGQPNRAAQRPQEGHLTVSGAFMGTPAYMSPEQAKGDPVDSRSDVYGAGVLLYQMVTAKLPFPTDGPLDKVLNRIASSEPPSPRTFCPELDVSLEAICLKAIAKRPADRYRSAAELAETLERYRQNTRKSRGLLSRRRIWLALAAAGGFLFGTTFIITVVTNRGMLVIETLDEHVKVSVLKDGREVAIVDTKTGNGITLHAGQYTLDLTGGEEGLRLSTNQFVLRRGDRAIVRVQRSEPPDVVWDARFNLPEYDEISEIKLTPDGKHLIVFCNTESSEIDAGSDKRRFVARVVKLVSDTGALVGDKRVALRRRVTCCGWVDSGGNIYLTSKWGGYTLWKFDPELRNQLWSYTGASGFEYVENVVTDASGSVYAAGYEGSNPSFGSKCVKLDPNGKLLWQCVSKHTEGHDHYTRGLALDSKGNLFRAGWDHPDPENSFSNHGRIMGHSGVDGSEIMNQQVAEPNSRVGGILIDGHDCLYVAYTYNRCTKVGQTTGKERTVVQKRDRRGNVLWEYLFDAEGMYVHRHDENNGWHFYSSEYADLSLRPCLEVTTIPEPTTISLIGMGVVGLLACRRQKSRN